MLIIKIVSIVVSVILFLISVIYLKTNKKITSKQKISIATKNFQNYFLKIFYLIIGGVK